MMPPMVSGSTAAGGCVVAFALVFLCVGVVWVVYCVFGVVVVVVVVVW